MEDLVNIVSRTSTLVSKTSSILGGELTLVGKNNLNPSTNIDIKISNYLAKGLKQILKTKVISEEVTDDDELSNNYVWLIDPLDGTVNYISGSPDIAISVALVDSRFEAIAAVIYLPHYEEMYTAIKGNGAYLNDKKLQASAPSLKIASYGIPGDGDRRSERISQKLKSLISSRYILRQSGSAAVDICRVAKGCWTVFFEEGLFWWDIAAADLIATESGCSSITSDGETHDYEVNYLVGNCQPIFNEIKAIMEV